MGFESGWLQKVLRGRAADVNGLARRIERAFPGSQVTSAKDLAARISGSLVDASNLANRLGIALIVIALVAAFSIASLLTLSSVTKRVRELGTLRAVGWRRRLVIRQVIAESLAQGLIGAVAGSRLTASTRESPPSSWAAANALCER